MNGAVLQKDVSITELKDSLKEYSGLMAKLNSMPKVSKKSLKVGKKDISQKGKEEVRIYFGEKINKAFNTEIFEDVSKMIRLTHESYEKFKRVLELGESTHCWITRQALNLVNVNPALSALLLEYCKYPDDPKSDMQDLIFEGHFYGETNTGAWGNFIENLPTAAVLVLEGLKKARNGLDEDIHEHALENFATNYDLAMSVNRNAGSLGIAAHYLQDLTAPHHVGNYPAVPYVDHYFFEKYANLYVYGSPQFVLTKSEYDTFKGSLNTDLSKPEAFATEIYNRAKAFVPFIETDLHAETAGTNKYSLMVDSEIDKYNRNLTIGSRQWKEAVDKAIPLAVYATAYLFENGL
ncbi:MAG: hypothetical protein HPY65_15775 [Syntrophaceae bacterium]|nr:hypothetical protein [Syntrophaceae bacterium]